MRVVEVGMPYCPSFSAIDVMESQEDMKNKEYESLLCIMAWILVTSLILFHKATIAVLCIKPTPKKLRNCTCTPSKM
jgi:hypothetical protein